MAQLTTGIRSVLSHPWIYALFQKLIGSRNVWTNFLRDGAHLRAHERVLDVGCGTGNLLSYLDEEIEYVGVDLSPEYIAAAQERWGPTRKFYCKSVAQLVTDEPLEGSFDLIVMGGLLHHLDDGEARDLFRYAYKALKPGGRVATSDPCLVEGQSPLARFIISRDRGQNVRSPAQYKALAQDHFPDLHTTLLHDQLRIPYTHFRMLGIKPNQPAPQNT